MIPDNPIWRHALAHLPQPFEPWDLEFAYDERSNTAYARNIRAQIIVAARDNPMRGETLSWKDLAHALGYGCHTSVISAYQRAKRRQRMEAADAQGPSPTVAGRIGRADGKAGVERGDGPSRGQRAVGSAPLVELRRSRA